MADTFKLRQTREKSGRATNAGCAWKLEDAKARFSELVRRARSEGPQRVSVRGKDAVVVISVEELERLAPPDANRPPLVAFLESLRLDRLDLERERDVGRDVGL
jgi:prevent-host-death family protein